VRTPCRTRLIGREIRAFDTLDSTQIKAKQLASEGAPSGTVVVARGQTASRGRLGRAWQSERDAGLYMSIILRPARSLDFLSLAAGVAVLEVLRRQYALDAAIKWPNDVYICGRKVCGILIEGEAPLPIKAQGAGGETPVQIRAQKSAGGEVPLPIRAQGAGDETPLPMRAQNAGGEAPLPMRAQNAGDGSALIMGIGINTNWDLDRADVGTCTNWDMGAADVGVGDESGQKSAYEATSLSRELGTQVDHPLLLGRLLEALDIAYAALCRGTVRPLLTRVRKNLYGIGRKVFFDDGTGGVRSAVLIGIDDRGRALVRDTEGRVTAVIAGEVRLADRD
jgi:biotin-(acetyl-CoA carboxylase) ligase